MKIAFITHAIGIGGGSMSSSITIRHLIANRYLQAEDCIVIHDTTKDPPNEKNDVYFPLRNQITFYTFKVPLSQIYKGVTSNYLVRLYHTVQELIACLSFVFFYNKILLRENITTVHLNSIVLWPLLLVLPKSMKTIIHIREVTNDSLEARIAIEIIKRYSTKIISIDPISDIPFSDSAKSKIIFNPFNMTKARQLRVKKTSIKSELGLPSDAFIISLIGRVGEEKGLGFFIDIVKSSVEIKNLYFLIIGKTMGTYGENGIQVLKEYPNVKFLGENPDNSEFYAITDVVIRCEDYLPLGRTVWEGIFSGGLALVPVNKNDDISVITEYLGKYIFTYQALNVESCIQMVKKIMNQYPDTVLDSGYPVTDNIAKSAEQFFEVIQS